MKDHVVFLSAELAAIIHALLLAFQQNRDPELYKGTLSHALEELAERMNPTLREDFTVGFDGKEPKA